MDIAQLEKLKKKLASRMPLLGRRRRFQAAKALWSNGGLPALEVLAHTVAQTADLSLKQWLQEQLATLGSLEARQRICKVWAQSREPSLADIIKTWNVIWFSEEPDPVRALTALLLGTSGTAQWHPDEIPLLVQYCRDEDPLIAKEAISTIARLTGSSSRELICEQWLTLRDDLLLEAIGQWDTGSAEPSQGVIYCRLALGQWEPLRSCSRPAIPFLLQARKDQMASISEGAEKVLRGLEKTESRDALCHALLIQEDTDLEALILDCGFTPSQPLSRAIFFLLTRQWEMYQEVDFDGSLLRLACAQSPAPLRQRILARIREQGRTEWLSAFTGSPHKPEKLSFEEWQLTLEMLKQHQQWDRIDELTLRAPAALTVDIYKSRPGFSWESQSEKEGDVATLISQWPKSLPNGIRFGPSSRLEPLLLQSSRTKVQSIAISPHGLYLAALYEDAVQIASLETMEWVQEHPAKPTDKSQILFLPWATRLASGSTQLEAIPPGLKDSQLYLTDATCFALHPKEPLLICGDSEGIELWDLHQGNGPTAKWGRNHSWWIGPTSVAISPDGKWLACGTHAGLTYVWSTSRTEPQLPQPLPQVTSEPVSRICFRPDSLAVAAIAAEASTLVWQLGSVLEITH